MSRQECTLRETKLIIYDYNGGAVFAVPASLLEKVKNAHVKEYMIVKMKDGFVDRIVIWIEEGYIL